MYRLLNHISYSHIPRTKNSFFIRPFKIYEIKTHIKGLDTSKSVRPGDPPIKFLKMACDVIAPVLTKLFNLCVQQSTFPKTLKEGCIIPIYKKGDPSISGNYRPISLLSPFSKIFEKCILNQLNSFFSKHNLINPNQFGFQKGISTEMAVSQIYNSIIVNDLEAGMKVCSAFLYISKAFDSVNHKILITKLALYGIRGPPSLLIKSFLTNRTQYTIINSHRSSSLQVTSGVPQGSVLGPLLFVMFINDLPLITGMQTTLFADDACLRVGHASLEYIQSYVNSELQKVEDWMNQNKLNLNVSKTNFVLFNRSKQPVSISLQYNNTNLERTDVIRYLGVLIDDKLNFSAHITFVKNKLINCLWAICKLKNYTNPHTLKLVYYSMAYPFLQYCITTWGGTFSSLLEPLFRKQKIIVRNILNQPYRSHSTPLFHTLELLKLEDIYKLQIGKLMKKKITDGKITNNTTTNNLILIASVHSHNTRSSHNENYFLPTIRTNLGKTNFSFNGPKIWNSFPLNVKNSPNSQFKHVLKEHLLNNYKT